MRLALVFLLLAVVAGPADAQSPPAEDTEQQAARALSCAAFLSEKSRHTGAGGAAGTTPSFSVIWGALLKRDPDALAKVGLGRTMFQNTVMACERMRGRTLGATMDAEFARL